MLLLLLLLLLLGLTLRRPTWATSSSPLTATAR
jgi:hypothetical protein